MAEVWAKIIRKANTMRSKSMGIIHAELLDQLVISRVGLVVDGLQAPRPIHMRDRREHLALTVLHVHYVQHEAGWIVPLRFGQHEIGRSLLLKDRRRKWSERFAELDFGIHDIF